MRIPSACILTKGGGVLPSTGSVLSFSFQLTSDNVLETLHAAYPLRDLASSLKSNEGKERLWPPSHLSAVDAGSLGKSQAQSYRRRCLHYSRTPLECFYKMTILFFTHFPLSQIDRITGWHYCEILWCIMLTVPVWLALIDSLYLNRKWNASKL